VSAPSATCSNSVATIAAVDGTAANDIYEDELHGSSTADDLNHITTSTALLTALADKNTAATLVAVNHLVYHPAWHIVRLRVFNNANQLLADVGGPYVISPVTGSLYFKGQVVGRFVMSVQDDVGFTKLESRTVGDAIGIYVKGKLAVEQVQGQSVTIELGGSFPSAEPRGQNMILAGRSYHVLTLTYHSFPNNQLQAVIAVPQPPQSNQSCAAIRVSELARVTAHLSERFSPLNKHYHEFVGVSGIFIGVHLIVREGATVLATNIGPGPARLPLRGSVQYRGTTWLVVSSSPAPGVRIYILTPTNPLSSSSVTSTSSSSVTAGANSGGSG
jgi:hypothetical protein